MNWKVASFVMAIVYGLTVNLPVYADAAKCLNTFYSMVNSEFNYAYIAQGRPKADFDGLGKVKAAAMARLEANASKWPKGATFSVSVLSNYISVYVYCDGKQKHGEWRPAGMSNWNSE